MTSVNCLLVGGPKDGTWVAIPEPSSVIQFVVSSLDVSSIPDDKEDGNSPADGFFERIQYIRSEFPRELLNTNVSIYIFSGIQVCNIFESLVAGQEDPMSAISYLINNYRGANK